IGASRGGARRKRLALGAQNRREVLHINVLEHVPRDSVDRVVGSVAVDHVNGARLLLVTFASFAVQIVQRECHFGAQRQRLVDADAAPARLGSASTAAVAGKQAASPQITAQAGALAGRRSTVAANALSSPLSITLAFRPAARRLTPSRLNAAMKAKICS